MMDILPIILVIALQVLDVSLHVATDQFEIIRTASNVIAAFAVIVMYFAPKRALSAMLVSGAGYIALNAVFLAQNGVVNPSTSALRLPLFGFVGMTLVLLFWSSLRAKSANE